MAKMMNIQALREQFDYALCIISTETIPDGVRLYLLGGGIVTIMSDGTYHVGEGCHPNIEKYFAKHGVPHIDEE